MNGQTGHAETLSAIFQRLIANTGPISLMHFMGEANARYYNSRDPFGDQGVRALEARLKDHRIRALPQRGPDGQAKFDSKERVIAELLVGDQNIGLSLVHDGLALVYTPYTFDTISTYLEQQGRARDAGRGVWGDAEGIKRADALIAQWARSREEGG